MENIVLKFGGTSVKDADAMKRSAQIALDRNAKIVLVSATSGTTNQLVSLSMINQEESLESRDLTIDEIEKRHLGIANEIHASDEVVSKVKDSCQNLRTLVRGTNLLQDCSPKFSDRILAVGELLSSALFSHVINSMSDEKEYQYFDIREVMKTNYRHMQAEPLLDHIKTSASKNFNLKDSNTCYVSQGFIGSTLDGMTTTLGRGGSDYSAALIAEPIDAKQLEIWTDVEGVKTTDPRICP